MLGDFPLVIRPDSHTVRWPYSPLVIRPDSHKIDFMTIGLYGQRDDPVIHTTR